MKAFHSNQPISRRTIVEEHSLVRANLPAGATIAIERDNPSLKYVLTKPRSAGAAQATLLTHVGHLQRIT
jgi:hypothetical protein